MNNVLAPVVAIVVFLGIVFGIVVVANSYYGNEQHNGCVVIKTDRTTKAEGGSDARVYTKNCGTFKVADSFWKGKFRSGDTFGSIEQGHTYNFTTIGWRNGFFSMFPNIITATQVS